MNDPITMGVNYVLELDQLDALISDIKAIGARNRVRMDPEGGEWDGECTNNAEMKQCFLSVKTMLYEDYRPLYDIIRKDVVQAIIGADLAGMGDFSDNYTVTDVIGDQLYLNGKSTIGFQIIRNRVLNAISYIANVSVNEQGDLLASIKDSIKPSLAVSAWLYIQTAIRDCLALLYKFKEKAVKLSGSSEPFILDADCDIYTMKSGRKIVFPGVSFCYFSML